MSIIPLSINAQPKVSVQEKMIQTESYDMYDTSNVIIDDSKTISINFSKFYDLYVYTLEGKFIKKYTRNTQYLFRKIGQYYLKYVQAYKGSEIIQIISYTNQ